jgi:diguanylate cyclase (GGDEF)-like protein
VSAESSLGNETGRLASLRGLGILDTPAEARFDSITRLAQRLLRVEASMISLVDERRIWYKSTTGTASESERSAFSFCAQAIQKSEPLLVEDATSHPLFCNNPIVQGATPMRFYAGIPLRTADGYQHGTLCVVDRERRSLTADELDDLRALAANAERELNLKVWSEAQTALIQELQAAQQAARLDGLLRTWSRGTFEQIAEAELAVAHHSGSSGGFAILDVDHFKSINDTHGHAAGDAVLREVARRVRESIRSNDVLGRYGGDELVLLVTDINEHDFARRLESLRNSVRAPIPVGEVEITCTLSIGATWWGTGAVPPTFVAMLNRADHELYKVKRGGRDGFAQAVFASAA